MRGVGRFGRPARPGPLKGEFNLLSLFFQFQRQEHRVEEAPQRLFAAGFGVREYDDGCFRHFTPHRGCYYRTFGIIPCASTRAVVNRRRTNVRSQNQEKRPPWRDRRRSTTKTFLRASPRSFAMSAMPPRRFRISRRRAVSSARAFIIAFLAARSRS